MRELTRLFKALSDENRLRILNLIIQAGELCVCDLQRVLGFTQTKVSRHLAYLKHSGILVDRRQGGWMVYRLANTDDPTKKILFKELRDLFKDEPTLQNDIQKLEEQIADGHCVSLCVLPELRNAEVRS